MASDDEPENENVDLIWTTWKYGHDLAFGAAALMADKMADGMEADPVAERGDPVNVLRSFAGLLRMGKYSPKERAHAMMPIDDAINHILDDPRVLVALSDKFATGCLPPGSAAYVLGCLKEILLPPGDDDE